MDKNFLSGRINDTIIKIVRTHYPSVQGIYLFGSHSAQEQWPGSDIDIAIVLPPELAKKEKNLILSQCRFDLEEELSKDIDLLNARRVLTVFQKEVITKGSLILCTDRYAVDEFEMLTLSYYQKLNEERKSILKSFFTTKRAYNV